MKREREREKIEEEKEKRYPRRAQIPMQGAA